MLPSPRFRLRRSLNRALSARVIACIGGACALAATLAVTQQVPQQQDTSSSSQPRPWASSQPAAIRMPDAVDQMQMQQQHSKGAKFEAANTERRRQISDDAAKLLELATELKSAVDKTDKDTLSLDVIRKAESIEKLAKGVKEKMKLTAGAS